MKRALILYIANILCLLCSAQQISVKSFKLLENDLTANTNGTTEYDQNEDKAALIKVVTTQTGFSFDCGSLGIVKTEQKPSEIWVYVPRGVRRITISHPSLGVLRDYEFPVPIEGARTYEMALSTDKVETIVKHDADIQYLTINVRPITAIVKIDGTEVPVVDSVVTKLVTYGQHTYSVTDPYYKDEQGIINMGKEKQTINVFLTPNYGKLQISSTPENGAQVFMDDGLTSIGTTPLTTNKIIRGSHSFRLKLSQYETKDTVIEVAGDGKTRDLQIPMNPTFGVVHITAPSGCSIFVNNQNKGLNSYNGRLTEGIYEIEARKESHRPYLTSIEIHKGETKNVALSSPTPIYGTLNVNSRPIGANVFVDGKLRGTTPLILNDVLIGKRNVKIEKDGYEASLSQAIVKEDGTSDINVMLQYIRNKSRVTFTCNEKVDSLFIDGKVGNAYGNNYLTPGIHKISFVAKGQRFNDNIMVPKVPKRFNLIVRGTADDLRPITPRYDESNKVFDVVEQMPSFPGGQGALMQYIANNVRYPVNAQVNGVQGRVVVSLVVETDGSISNVEVVRSVSPELDQEAIRVVSNMPKWIPGKQNGKPIRVRYNVPVSFRLQ